MFTQEETEQLNELIELFSKDVDTEAFLKVCDILKGVRDLARGINAQVQMLEAATHSLAGIVPDYFKAYTCTLARDCQSLCEELNHGDYFGDCSHEKPC